MPEVPVRLPPSSFGHPTATSKQSPPSEADLAQSQALLASLRNWFREVWKTERTVFVTTEQFTQQVALIQSTELHLEFELVEPDKPGTYLVFGD